MCLASAYMGIESETPVLQEIARLRIDDDTIEMETLFGEGTAIKGRLVEVDFTNSRVVIEE